MKNMKAILSLVLLLCSGSIWAQSITISGYVSEKKSGERLLGATVFIPDRNIGTTTNTYGFYSLTIPAGANTELRATYIGFAPFTQTITGEKNVTLNIELDQAKDLKEVVVTAQKDAIQTRTQMSAIDLPIETIKSLPAFMGEVDILKAIQLLPGVQGGNEGTSGLYVRGGGPDQNLILLDGVPVYNASHLFGFFSVFNADAIRSVEVIKGGFPARYGGRLSSVIDINMKEGDKNKLHGEGGIGLIASRLMLEGPIQKGKSSFMVSGRRTYIDVLAQPLMRGNLKSGYYFYDLNGKANFKITEKDHIYISGYFGNDKFYARQTEDNGTWGASSFNTGLRWGNITAVGRWNHEFSPKLFGNLTTYYSQYQFLISAQNKSTFTNVNEDYLLKYTSGINDKAVKYDFDFLPGPNHFIKAGVGYIAHTYKPGAQQIKLKSSVQDLDTTFGVKDINAGEIDGYIEDDIRISSKLKANLGVHWTGFTVRDQLYQAIQPRAGLRYLLSDEISLKASYVQMNQFIHLLTNSSIGLPTDLWVPVTDRVPAQKSHQAAIGAAYTHNTGIEISVEGYYKTMENVLEYKEGASFFNSSTSWEDKVEIGKGKSYGGELFLQKKKGKFTGMLGYTLSWTTRQFDNLNNGEEFPYRYDRRHDVKVAGIYKLSNSIELSAEWIYGTGNAITMPLGMYQGQDGQEVAIYGSRNGYRMPAYHRGDVSVKFWKQRKGWERAWIISAYNIYNRMNPFYVYSETNNGKTTFKQISLFPIIPSISYQFKF
ncbi:TonB-dependent receptor [Polluticoccus soli]|uniref:TonB-dependent receptor n=1 Tax=Polluticoccus soli TaxID=3034150 RepID=UPI0023E184AF|nr:TonB-dependent receptor [Flavipsychrobacter sp. JY13-12]